MADWSALKRLAEAVCDDYWAPDVGMTTAETVYACAAAPGVVLSLLADLEQAKADLIGLRESMVYRTSLIGRLEAERDQMRGALAEVVSQVDGNIRPTVRDCVNGLPDVQDIYAYCDQIEAIATAALAKEAQHG